LTYYLFSDALIGDIELMKDCVLKINQVTKSYRGNKILDNISMTIQKGQVYGLVGLNGAGKSTLIKIITGLVMPDSGSLELFGNHEKDKIEANRRRIGAVVETVALYDNKTVYENMNLSRIQKGIPGEDSIDKFLNIVGLTELKNKKVKKLSLGSKQSLGIAMALLGEPEFLILDEPINGLDPIKIIEIRDLLIKLNVEYGVTMIISSHILSELYHVANHYGIIHKGKLIKQISLKELKEQCKNYVHIKVDDTAKASVVISEKLSTKNFVVLPNNIIKLYDYVDFTGKITETLVNEGITVEQIMPMGDDLESYFTRIVGGVRDA
jgi:ABC-2 type transport system ATP-binding protein